MIDPLRFFRSKPIKLLPVHGVQMTVPVADLVGKSDGKTLLVTAGLDGDEYAGIEAAYELIEHFSHRNFSGRLVVLPIVNMHGFEAEQSKNPLDNTFPKYVFPGSSSGTETERLIHWLATTYAYEADAWLDLHSGAITESATAHLWASETGIPAVDELSRSFCGHAGVPVVLQKASPRSKERLLAERGCLYLLTESGGRGERGAKDVGRHIAWAELLMGLLHMHETSHTDTQLRTPQIFHAVEKVLAAYDGVFTLSPLSTTIKKGELIGTCHTYDGVKPATIRAPREGTVLWHKQTMAMRKGDTLCAIAY